TAPPSLTSNWFWLPAAPTSRSSRLVQTEPAPVTRAVLPRLFVLAPRVAKSDARNAALLTINWQDEPLLPTNRFDWISQRAPGPVTSAELRAALVSKPTVAGPPVL